jgi:hypothetical protein
VSNACEIAPQDPPLSADEIEAWRKFASVFLIAILGVAPLAFHLTFTDWSDPAIREILAKHRVHLGAASPLSADDIAELEKRAAAHFIPDVIRNPTFTHRTKESSWRVRLTQIWSEVGYYGFPDSDTIFAARGFTPIASVVVDAELIPSSNTGPEMRYGHYFLDQDHVWRPTQSEPPIYMSTYTSWYF